MMFFVSVPRKGTGLRLPQPLTVRCTVFHLRVLLIKGGPLRRCSWDVFVPQRTSPYPQGCLTLRRSCMGRVEYPMVPAYVVMAETITLTYLLPERSSLPVCAGVTYAGFPAQRMRFPFRDLHPLG